MTAGRNDSETHIGPYRFLARLGNGSMADVYLALRTGPVGTGFAKLAVIKRIRKHLIDDADFITMLMDEARICSRLSHPNVVETLELGSAGGEYFIAMEHLDGQPLHRIEQRLDRAGLDVPRESFVGVIADVLEGLHHAHELTDFDGSPLAIVHRDVTPHNVFVTYHGQVKVVDFGIARAQGRASQTRPGMIKGKLRYMSPEQARGEEIDRRTDVFAAGVMLWQAATKHSPFAGVHEEQAMADLASGQYPRSPREAGEDISPELDRICARALAFDANDRYATAAEMRADLDEYLGERANDARRALVEAVQTAFARDREKMRKVLEDAIPGVALAAQAPILVRTAPRKPAPKRTSPRTRPRASKSRRAPPPSPWRRRAGMAALAVTAVSGFTFALTYDRPTPASSPAPSLVVGDRTGYASPVLALAPRAESTSAAEAEDDAASLAHPGNPLSATSVSPPATSTATSLEGADTGASTPSDANRLNLDQSDPWRRHPR